MSRAAAADHVAAQPVRRRFEQIRVVPLRARYDLPADDLVRIGGQREIVAVEILGQLVEPEQILAREAVALDRWHGDGFMDEYRCLDERPRRDGDIRLP